MHLRDYFPALSKEEREALAQKVRVSVGHLRNSMYGAPLSPLVVAKLEHHTKGGVTRKAHYPNNYADIWPELAEEEEPSIVSKDVGGVADRAVTDD